MLTSGEVQQLLQSHGQPLTAIAQAPLDTLVPGVQDDPRLYGIPGGSGVLASDCKILHECVLDVLLESVVSEVTSQIDCSCLHLT